MQPFSCGLSLVRNQHYQYAYIDTSNRPIVPFGKYTWCDPQFTCGYARVMEYHPLEGKNLWGIINTLGSIVIPLKYDKIWVIKEEYLGSINAFIDNREERINLYKSANKIILNGLNYISIYTVDTFKQLSNCQKIFIKATPNSRQLFFTYGCNMGCVAGKSIPKDPVIAIVINSNGQIFPLLMDKSDIGKTSLPTIRATIKKDVMYYNEERVNDDIEDWEDQFLDAFEGDESNYWNIE